MKIGGLVHLLVKAINTNLAVLFLPIFYCCQYFIVSSKIVFLKFLPLMKNLKRVKVVKQNVIESNE